MGKLLHSLSTLIGMFFFNASGIYTNFFYLHNFRSKGERGGRGYEIYRAMIQIF